MVETPLESNMVTRLTSRKFWALNTVMAASFVGTWLAVSKLCRLVVDEKIGDAVFENLFSLVVTTEALFLTVMVAWYFGVNALQHIKLAQIGGGK